MSLFDFIENDHDQTQEPVTPPVETGTKSQPRDAHNQQTRQPGNQATRHHQPRKAARPEKLNFLKPCPICLGREFTYGKDGGFFCATCQPGIPGRPVIALGHRGGKTGESAKGLPCRGCGSTTYKKKKEGYQFPDGSITDGWHCGGEGCGVKLISGNKEADRKTRDQLFEGNQGRQDLQNETAISHPPPGQRLEKEATQYFRASYPWIMEHLPELLAAGWTRPELFRRDKTAWPVGRWGVAWLSVWARQDLSVTIGCHGEIEFRFPSSGRKIVQQRAYPGHQTCT